MLAPRMLTINGLPRESMVHFLSEDATHHDIDPSKAYYVGSKKILVDYVETLTGTEGNPRHKNVLIKALFRKFHVDNKHFRYLKDHYLKVNDQLTLFVYNYSYLDVVNRYTALPLTNYYKWWNVQKTIFDTIAKVNQEHHKNHFLFIDVPEDVPSFSFLRIYEHKVSTSLLKIFNSHSKLFVLQMWKFLAGNAKESIFSGLSEADFSTVNLVFTLKDGRSSIVNMGYLHSWIKGNENTTEYNAVTQLNNLQIQKLFLKFLITLHSPLPEEVVEDTLKLETNNTVVDPEDQLEHDDLVNAQNEYNDEHDISENDDIDSHEYQDALSELMRLPSSAKGKAEITVQDDIKLNAALTNDNTLLNQLKEIDKDLSALELIAHSRLKERGIKIDETGNVVEEKQAKTALSLEAIHAKVYGHEDFEASLKRQVNEQADYGMLSAADYKRFIADVENYKEMPNPYNSKEKTVDAMVVHPSLLKLDASKTAIEGSDLVSDKSMLQSSLQSFDHDYVTKVMKKDVLSMVSNLQKSGVVIRKHEIEVDHSALGSYESHTLEIKPIDGVTSTVRYRVPVVNEDGTFSANGNKYVMRKQRVDIPIRKINPFTVALTTYYGKTFVTINQKKANNSLEWIAKELDKAAALDEGFIKQVNTTDVFDNSFVAPYIYNGLANKYKSIVTSDFTLLFDHNDRETLFSPDVLLKLEVNGSRLVGHTNRNEPIIVDNENQFHIYRVGNLVAIGDVYQVLQLHAMQAPVDFTEVRVFSKVIPIVLVVGYSIGFHHLLTLLNAKYRKVEPREQLHLDHHEYAIKFKDVSYVFSRNDIKTSLIVSGLLEFDKELKRVDVEDLDSKDIYLNLLESKGLGSIYIREIDLTQQLFVDPISKGILEQMKEPTTFNGLLLRSSEMLMTYHHPDSQDMRAMRIRGYERIPGAIYKEMVTSLRQYRNKNIAGKSKIDISPYQVWTSIMKDPAIKLVEDINPIQNLKESEIVTYVGEGGRSKDGMNRASRAYHHTDMGIVSEATVDSSDVGVNAYLSANPEFQDLRGIPNSTRANAPSSLLSTSTLLSPSATNDDPKRVNYISIQQSHTISAMGYRQPMVRTGYEYVIGNRTGDMFCYNAKQDGKVINVDDKGIIVEYADKSIKGVVLGRVYGKAEGSVYPHDIKTTMKAGQKFKKGDNIAYNEGFFERDFLDPSKVIMKNSKTVTTVLYESNQTHEDSSAISKELTQSMATYTTKVKSFIIDFKQNLREVVKEGTKVSPKDFLMIIEDEITSTNGVFDEKSLSSLKKLANQAPRASYLGNVDRIEVFYNGDKSDMTPTLKALADKSDKFITDTCKSSGKPIFNGQVTEDYRVSGVSLTMDKAEVKFYITVKTDAGIADKFVVGSQLKNTVGEIMDYTMTTEDGTKIETVYGIRGVFARIVPSAFIIGTTSTLLKLIAKKAVEAYKR